MAFITKIFLLALLTATLCLGRTSSPYPRSRNRGKGHGPPDKHPTYNSTWPLNVQFVNGPTEEGTVQVFELIAARRAIKKLKSLISQEDLKTLLAADIAAGDDAWHTILDDSQDDDSDPNPGDRVLAEVHFTAIPWDCPTTPAVNFTSLNFAAWFANSAFFHVQNLWDGHPEHYGIIITANNDTTLGAELIEPWGPLLTNSKVPRFTPVTGQPGGGVKMPWMKAMPDFPIQMVGDETLTDGSGDVVGKMHYSWKDLAKGTGTCGVEAVLDMWMPSGTPEDVAEGMRQHLAVEYNRWVNQAYADIKSGAFVPS